MREHMRLEEDSFKIRGRDARGGGNDEIRMANNEIRLKSRW